MKTLVVIPTYQEAETITALLDAVLHADSSVDVLVVDDGSPDGTGQLVAEHPAFGRQVFQLQRSYKAGLGAAYRAGIGWALDSGYEAVLQMDADFSHPPESIPALLTALDTADVAIGSRYVPGGRTVGWPLVRRLVSKLGNVYVRLVLGLTVLDATAGYRAFRGPALAAIDVVHSESDGYAFQIETTLRAARASLRIVEVPITFTERSAGTSKMNAGIAAEALIRVLGWRVRELTGRGRRPVGGQDTTLRDRVG